MRLIVLLIALATLTGCLEDRKAALARCEFEAARGGQVWLCMRGAGYEVRTEQKVCLEPLQANSEYCYRPVGLFARWSLELDAWWQGGAPAY